MNSLYKDAVIESQQIESCAFGGSGIFRHDGMVVFVPFAAPGDWVKAKVIDVKKTYARGALIEIEKPGKTRVQAKCPHFSQCGGCHLQHLDYQTQLQLKQQWVKDALSRIAKLDNADVRPTRATTQNWRYRRYVRLHLRGSQKAIRLGFVAEDNSELTEIQHCSIFSEHDIISKIRNICMLFEDSSQHFEGEISIFKAAPENRFVVLFDFMARVPKNAEKVLTSLKRDDEDIQGMLLRGQNICQVIGDPSLSFELDGLHFTYSPLGFVQAHPEQSLALYRDLVEHVAVDARRVLDLYCGIGATSLLLARRGIEVLGVEVNPRAIECARANAARNRIDNIAWEVADVDRMTKPLGRVFKPDTIVVNPPRIGLSESVRNAIIQLRPLHVFYVSCMPSTLARDLHEFAQAGYQIKHCQPYDMFPQTTHVETLVHLCRVD